ncbi:DUF2306 domain-containing protein [Tunturiibacter gelidoferens]|uniref:DUF2306 domain-containing protein n=1 Tax=Tunturiibacter lichenicola TaxID=2051959 RepID=A0A7Y9NP33_9BACT|nr:DUF2306 domain-containing protein [Edaphobacter lichenicola]NYF52945.1 hypothetical protein [Edaphobacter lichenicola]
MDTKASARGVEVREGSFRAYPKYHQYPGWLKVGFWFCVVIAVAVVLRRVAVFAHLAQGGSSSPTAALDAVFASHEALTLAHILPAMAFVLLSPSVLLQRSRTIWAERLFFPLGAWVGVTAYAMSAHPVGGWVERSAVLLFNSLFLFSLLRAFVAARRGEAVEKMRWMLRSVAILLGIATTRPVMGVFFATSRLTHLEPAQFFGVAFWIGFSINTIAIELWLRSRGDRLPVVG